VKKFIIINFVHKFFRRGNYAFSCPSHAKSTVLTAVHDGRHHDGIVTLSWGTCSSINFSDTVRESILTVHHFSLRGVAKLRRFFVKIVKVLRRYRHPRLLRWKKCLSEKYRLHNHEEKNLKR